VKITVKKRRKKITVTEITFDGIVLPDDGVELLSEALDADGMFNAIVINSTALRTALEKKGYINTNSSWRLLRHAEAEESTSEAAGSLIMILTPRQIAQIDRSVSFVGGTQYTVNDLLETAEFYQSLGESKSLCGHPEQYSRTEDGGKHIVCLICEVDRLSEELKRRDW
jgi:hypothetical protein